MLIVYSHFIGDKNETVERKLERVLTEMDVPGDTACALAVVCQLSEAFL